MPTPALSPGFSDCQRMDSRAKGSVTILGQARAASGSLWPAGVPRMLRCVTSLPGGLRYKVELHLNCI